MTSAAAARASALERARRLEGVNLVNGKLVAPAAGGRFELYDPATRELIVQVANSSATEVDDAVAAARDAQSEWAALPARTRGKLLIEAGRVLAEHAA